MALTALLMAFYRQSKRRTAEFLGASVGPTLLPGADRENPKPSDRMPCDRRMRRWRPNCRRRSSLNIDETATKEENGKAWL